MDTVASFVLSLFCLFHPTEPQHTQFNRNTQYCDGSNKTALVESFFKLILTEFERTPPACVCVQMCANQPTYCYPNGCFKRDSNRLTDEAEPVSQIQYKDPRVQIFLMEQKKYNIKDFLWKKNPEDVKRGRCFGGFGYPGSNGGSIICEQDKIAIRDTLPDPFKDKYKTALRYKKTPQVELKYNLREQVRNTKADSLNSGNVAVPKTRWPMKKHTYVNSHIFPSTHDSNPLSKANKFFMSVLPYKDVVNYPPRYTKRELKKADDTKFDAGTFYTSPETNNTIQNIHFSIDKLINDLIENHSEADDGGVVTNVGDGNVITEAISNITIRDELRNNVTSNNILFINSSTEDLYQSKYVNGFNEMIANMSKKIDIQNNTSFIMMERLTGGMEATQGDISDDLFANKSIATLKLRSEIDNTTIREEVVVAEESTSNIIPGHFDSGNIFFPNDNETDILKRSEQRVKKVLPSSKPSVISSFTDCNI